MGAAILVYFWFILDHCRLNFWCKKSCAPTENRVWWFSRAPWIIMLICARVVCPHEPLEWLLWRQKLKFFLVSTCLDSYTYIVQFRVYWIYSGSVVLITNHTLKFPPLPEWIQNSKKTAKTNGRIYKTAPWQNGEYTKQRILQNGKSTTANTTKQRILQIFNLNSQFYISWKFLNFSFGNPQ